MKKSWDYLKGCIERGVFEKAISGLTPRERLILRLRLGCPKGNKRHTLKEVGVILGLSNERVRQIEKRVVKGIALDSNL